MNDKIEEMVRLAYKNRFSLYYKPGECLVRTYYNDGSQHKEVAETIPEAVDKMIAFLKKQ